MPLRSPEIPVRKRSFWAAAPLVSTGLVIVLLLLTSFAIGAAFSTHQAAERAKVASALGHKYQEARFAVGLEESLERKYRLEPGPEIRTAHHNAAKALSVALNSVRLTGTAEDQALFDRVQAIHNQYLDALRRMFDAVDAQDPARVLAIDSGEVDPLFSRIEKEVNSASIRHDDEAIQRLDSLGQIEAFVFTATPVVFGAGLLLLGVFWIVLRGYRQRIDAANQRESERIKESALAEIERLKLAVEAEQQALVTQNALQAKKSADEANLAKTEFLSRMSHELRTPMNTILGFGQMLELNGGLSPEQRANVSYILKSGGHLLTLIDELLDVGRIEGGHLISTFESVSMQEMYAETLELLAPLIAERSLQVFGLDNCKGHVRADPQRLRQVVVNLLSNAIKYNRDAGAITVACRSVEAGRLSLEVSDTGQGIATDDLPRLFTPFERLGAERTGVEGTGLGLALSKRLVEAMHGTLTVRSTPGKGSTFIVDLPLGDTPQTRCEAELKAVIASEPSSAVTQTVLYIEDDPSNQELFRLILMDRPRIQLLFAEQGQLGLELARRKRPDLIVLDLHLPDMTGMEILARLRENPITVAIPVLILSADATGNSTNQLLAAGANAYMAKPFNVSELLDSLDELLSGPGHETAAAALDRSSNGQRTEIVPSPFNPVTCASTG